MSLIKKREPDSTEECHMSVHLPLHGAHQSVSVSYLVSGTKFDFSKGVVNWSSRGLTTSKDLQRWGEADRDGTCSILSC